MGFDIYEVYVNNGDFRSRFCINRVRRCHEMTSLIRRNQVTRQIYCAQAMKRLAWSSPPVDGGDVIKSQLILYLNSFGNLCIWY
jgi:hypothetical protein